MNIVFYYSEKPRERLLGEALKEGVKQYGDDLVMLPTEDYTEPLPDTDVACTLGVKGKSLQIMTDHLSKTACTLYFDKGYIRRRARLPSRWEYWRISVNGFQPVHYLDSMNSPSDRWDYFGIELKPLRKTFNNKKILYAGSSQKYCDYHELGDCTNYAVRMIRKTRRYTNREIIYRPKPSWKEAVPIKGTIFSRPPEGLLEVFGSVHSVVTHGSNVCLDAIIDGIPVIVLGDGVTKHICDNKLEYVENPVFPSDSERHQLCSNIAYCQWNNDELLSGEAWSHLRKEILRAK